MDSETLAEEEVKIKKNNDRDDFPSMFMDLFKQVNLKVAMFIFLIGMLIFSDLFIENVLINIPNSVIGDTTNNKGTLIQLLSLTIFYIVIDILVANKVL